MDIAKSETFKNFIILNKALLFLIKLSKTAVQSVPKILIEINAFEIWHRNWQCKAWLNWLHKWAMAMWVVANCQISVLVIYKLLL